MKLSNKRNINRDSCLFIFASYLFLETHRFLFKCRLFTFTFIHIQRLFILIWRLLGWRCFYSKVIHLRQEANYTCSEFVFSYSKAVNSYSEAIYSYFVLSIHIFIYIWKDYWMTKGKGESSWSTILHLNIQYLHMPVHPFRKHQQRTGVKVFQLDTIFPRHKNCMQF